MTTKAASVLEPMQGILTLRPGKLVWPASAFRDSFIGRREGGRVESMRRGISIVIQSIQRVLQRFCRGV